METTEHTLFVKMALDAWNTQASRADKLIKSLSNEALAQETAPGRNSGTYLVGHLTAVHDAMIPLLGLGDRLYPQLEEPFLKNPDKSGLEKPSIDDLRLYWNTVLAVLTNHFNGLRAEEWLSKHTSVSQEDFLKEPHRNKLNVLINKTNHLAYHLGQLAYLKK
ncbi:MAG: DinB family protein [Cytophaga sp.]|uniref:DinB family protein n=1 Tax=Cytophaga sp. TaxID=29535 RepID=UPI003F81B1F0